MAEKIDYKAQGKANKKKGYNTEVKIRKRLEDLGFIVGRWQNNVDLEKQIFVPAKLNPYTRNSTGFPDFVLLHDKMPPVFVECKSNGKLSRIEKEKCEFIESQGFKCWVGLIEEDGEVGFRKFVEYKRSSKIRRKKVGD